jgi:hypothetical protein
VSVYCNKGPTIPLEIAQLKGHLAGKEIEVVYACKFSYKKNIKIPVKVVSGLLRLRVDTEDIHLVLLDTLPALQRKSHEMDILPCLALEGQSPEMDIIPCLH